MKTKQRLLTLMIISVAAGLSGCITDKIKDDIFGKKTPDAGTVQVKQPQNQATNQPHSQPQNPQPKQPQKQPPKVHDAGLTQDKQSPKVQHDNNAHFRANKNVSLVQTTSPRQPKGAPNTGSHANRTAVTPLSPQEQALVMKAFENTNRLRAEKGLKPLVYDASLGAYASVRAREAVRSFSHTRPDGRSYSSGFINAVASAENLAAGHASPDQTVLKQWRNSSGHYGNILGNYDTIGIGYARDPNSKWGYYWVQVFSTRGAKTRYYFSDDTGAGAAQPPNMGNYLTGQIRFNDGKVDLGNAPSKRNTAARGHNRGELTHNIYANARSFSHGGYEAIIQDPSSSSFSYQTFGEVVDARGIPVQHVNIGQATIPQDNHQFSATYRGASLGNLNQDSHVYADVTAQVEFGARKTMNVQFQNSKIALHDIRDQNPNSSIRRADHLDFSEQLTWSDYNGSFHGGGVSARFYGPNGEEMGGQFERSAAGGVYEGVFGLEKQP